MSEEKEESGFAAIKKAVIGAITTGVAAGGAWLAGLFGGGGEEATPATPTNTPSPAPVVINLENNNTNQQKQSTGGPTVIKERVIEKPAAAPAQPAAKPAQDESDPW
jgi:hypothetical protein